MTNLTQNNTTTLLPIEHDPVAKALSNLITEIFNGERSLRAEASLKDRYETINSLYKLLQDRDVPHWAARVDRAIRIVTGRCPEDTPKPDDVLECVSECASDTKLPQEPVEATSRLDRNNDPLYRGLVDRIPSVLQYSPFDGADERREEELKKIYALMARFGEPGWADEAIAHLRRTY